MNPREREREDFMFFLRSFSELSLPCIALSLAGFCGPPFSFPLVGMSPIGSFVPFCSVPTVVVVVAVCAGSNFSEKYIGCHDS